MSTSTSLLDDLTEYLGFDYVSQLKELGKREKKLCVIYLDINVDADCYSLYQWNDACHYITHGELGWHNSPKDAKNNLIKWLNE